MKLVISDYRDTLASRDLDVEVALLQSLLPGARVLIHPYEGEEGLVRALRGASGLISAFVPVGERLFSQCPALDCVSVNATGYNAVDTAAAARHGVAVCAVGEYCTQEVADHTMAVLLALARRLKAHQRWIDRAHMWQYNLVGPVPRLQRKTFAIFGLGRIGQAVARRAKAFGFAVVGVDPYLPAGVAADLGIPLVSRETACETAHFITNHMMATGETAAYFDGHFFSALEQAPVFVNAARAESVEEAALVRALDEGLVSAAGLDVLQSVGTDLETNPLVGRDNVILTPHAAFYSDEALRALQERSCRNLAGILTGNMDLVDYWVNRAPTPLQTDGN